MVKCYQSEKKCTEKYSGRDLQVQWMEGPSKGELDEGRGKDEGRDEDVLVFGLENYLMQG